MSWEKLLEEQSALALALDVIGDKWSLMLVSCSLSGVCRFNKFEDFLGLNRNLLSSRLDKLVDAGVLEKHLYHENPPRYEYKATQIGQSLRAIITGLANWGEAHYVHDQAPFKIIHKECGQGVEVLSYCRKCERIIAGSELYTRLNETASEDMIKFYKNMRQGEENP